MQGRLSARYLVDGKGGSDLATTFVTIDGLDAPIQSQQGFTTVERYVEKAQAEDARVSFNTPTGRVSVRPDQVIAITEFKDGTETAEQELAGQAAGQGPFGQ